MTRRASAGTADASVTVQTLDLRAGLAAVRSHAYPKDDFPVLNRVHLTISPDGNLYLAATDRYTVGLAIVSVWEDHAPTGTVDTLDLSLTDVAEVLTLFKPSKRDEGEAQATLRVDVHHREVVFTDTTGLFPSDKQLRLPRQPAVDYPDMHRLIAGALRSAHRLQTDARQAGITSGALANEVMTSGVLPSRFKAAADAYGEPLVVMPTAERRAALLYTCGESFIGLLMPIRPDEDGIAKVRRWRRDWQNRLPEPGDTYVDLPDGPTVDLNDADQDQDDDGPQPGPGQTSIDDEEPADA